ncbi:hypothetical protein COL23_25685 [Priestia aryabhattai]|uniref:hypothetical protein n=1 Tax=Priestia aryabhattai TaxID=412384 RepID=UPI000BF9C145|nr:hypothetical protein [Priestia aryabhattai]PFW72145.1 hypothetical protein COL23_25685 [Priestia aryabhattai]
METRTKVILFRITLVLVVAFFVGGYFHQRNQDSREANTTKEVPQESSQSTESFTPFQKEKSTNESTEPMKSPNEGKKLADFYSTEDIEASKKVAEDFVRGLYPMDGNDMNKSVNDSSPYATENLTKMMKSEENAMQRPTNELFSRSLKEIVVKEPDEATPDGITLDVKVTGEFKNVKGEVTESDQTSYSLQLIKENDTFKVAEYSILN